MDLKIATAAHDINLEWVLREMPELEEALGPEPELEQLQPLAGDNDTIQFLIQGYNNLPPIAHDAIVTVASILGTDLWAKIKNAIKSIPEAAERNPEKSFIVGIEIPEIPSMQKRNLGFRVKDMTGDDVLSRCAECLVYFPQIAEYVNLINTKHLTNSNRGRIVITWLHNEDYSIRISPYEEGVFVEHIEVATLEGPIPVWTRVRTCFSNQNVAWD